MNIRSVNGRRLMVGAVKRTNAGSAIFIFLMSLCYLPAIGQIADLSTISVNGNVSSIIVDGGYTYIGGSFTQVGGQTRNMVARLKADGTLDPKGMEGHNVKAWLKDNHLKKETGIDMSKGLEYSFSGTGNAAADSTRFELVFIESGRPSTGINLDTDDAAAQSSVRLYPNPSKSADVTLSLRAMAPGAYEVHILDMTGRLVSASTLDHRSTNAEYRIVEGRLLSPGKYLIRLSQSGTLVQTLQFILE